MKRIIISIVVFGVFYLTMAAILVCPPVQAKGFSMTTNYKYILGLNQPQNDLETSVSMGHGVQMDFLWGLLDPTDEVSKVPGLSLGFTLAGGGLVSKSNGGFYKISILTEFNFDSGLGFSFGFGGAHIIDKQQYGALGFTDLGLRYSLKNGLIFSASVDLMVDPETFAQSQENSETSTDTSTTRTTEQVSFVLGVNVGIGYRF